MRVLVYSILAVTVGVSIGLVAWHIQHAPASFLTELPSCDYENYKVDSYIQAAARLQQMGQPAAVGQLIKLAKAAAIRNKQTELNEERTAILCRMLFVQRKGALFPGPNYLGSPCILSDRNPTNWPDAPIELVDGVPFYLVAGYSNQEWWVDIAAESYVRYCLTNCDWSGVHYALKSMPEKRRALNKLFDSPRWRPALDPVEKDLLVQQIGPVE